MPEFAVSESRDEALVRDVCRRELGLSLVRVRRLPGRSHRVYDCLPGDGPRLIARVSASARSRFPLEAELLALCAERRLAPVAALVFTGIAPYPPNGAEEDAPVALMIQEKAPGVRLRDYAEQRGRREARDVVRRAGEVLAGIHSFRTKGFGPLTSDIEGPERRLSHWFIDGLRDKATAAYEIAPETSGILGEAMDLLAAHREFLDTAEPHLLHGDFSPDNLLVDGNGQISAVLDWEAAKSGPPGMDIGWWDCFFDTPRTAAEDLVEGYRSRAGHQPEHLGALRHLTVVRVMIGHFSWTLSVNDADGIRVAADRLRQELTSAPSWSLAS